MTVTAALRDAERDALLARIDELRPESAARWGRLNAGRMVCHLSDQLRVALGELPSKPIPGPMRYPPVKQLVIHALPWPRGRVRAPPEGFTTTPATWEADVAGLRELLRRFAARERRSDWPDHPLFGRMSGGLWSALTRRHFDHHLTQFGV